MSNVKGRWDLFICSEKIHAIMVGEKKNIEIWYFCCDFSCVDKEREHEKVVSSTTFRVVIETSTPFVLAMQEVIR